MQLDVLIVGAGIVGSSLAIALSPLPLTVGILEANALTAHSGEHKPPEGMDIPITLNLASCRWLEAQGTWQQLADSATPIAQVHVSEQGCFGKLRFRAAELAAPALGYVLRRRHLLSILRMQLMELVQSGKTTARFKWLAPAQLQALKRDQRGWIVAAETDGHSAVPQVFSASMIVGADGHRSRVRELCAIPIQVGSREEAALVSQLNVSAPHPHTAYERFSTQGTIALLPFAEARMGLVWTASRAYLAPLAKLPATDFQARIQAIWGNRFGEIVERREPRVMQSLMPFHTAPLEGMPLVLLGNAAYSLHPIAAQSLNSSLADTATLVNVIQQAVYEGRESTAYLADYWQQRAAPQRCTRRLTEAIRTLFRQELRLLSPVRSIGLSVLDCLPAPKHWLAHQLMGLSAFS